jgi:hypothetical protein
MLQITSAIEVPVMHTVELLNWAMGGLAPDIVLKKNLISTNHFICY